MKGVKKLGIGNLAFYSAIEMQPKYNLPVIEASSTLTIDILERFGFIFERTDELGGWKLYRNKITIWVGAGGFQFNHDKAITFLDTVQDLLNLYYALTGDELTLDTL